MTSPLTLPFWQVDAFTDELFRGNPAGVVSLEGPWLPGGVLQSIAAENNLAETAFFRQTAEGQYDLRWFTPTVEVPLCGHATLASAHVLWQEMDATAERLVFRTLSGDLSVTQGAGGYTLSLPTDAPSPLPHAPEIEAALGVTDLQFFGGQYILAVASRAAAVRAASPDMAALSKVQLPARGDGAAEACVVLTAASNDPEYDFISRFFGPTVGVNEDPVTGSAHAMLTPYWADRLRKSTLSAYQCSSRGGRIRCSLQGDRVALTGNAVTYLSGTLRLSD